MSGAIDLMNDGEDGSFFLITLKRRWVKWFAQNVGRYFQFIQSGMRDDTSYLRDSYWDVVDPVYGRSRASTCICNNGFKNPYKQNVTHIPPLCVFSIVFIARVDGVATKVEFVMYFACRCSI